MQVCEDEEHTPKSDVWALGVSLYELCTLRLPFPGSNILAVLHAIISQTPHPLPAPYSTKLNTMIFAMLNKSPAQRPSGPELIARYLRPEDMTRMEREVTRHHSLVPQGVCSPVV